MDVVTNRECEIQSGTSSTREQMIELRERILLHLSECNDIHFKSQQIGEPELSITEKQAILEEVLNRNRGTFLSRFGHRLLPEHLSFFDTPDDKESYEVQFYLSKLRATSRKTTGECNVQVKNRRFQAMKKLMSEGEYFSVGEMRKRNPLLFDQLLGNFVKNPKIEVNHDQEYQIAHILLDQIEQDQVAALKKMQLDQEMEQGDGYSSSDDAPEDDEGYSTKDTTRSDVYNSDVVDRVLWGSAYKGDDVIGRTRWKSKHGGKKSVADAEADLSQEEKLLRINEFTSSMFNNFLQGKDEFDYSEVDNNPDYDDINQREIDEQEKYFDSESPNEAGKCGAQSGEDEELDRLYRDLNQEIKSEKLANEFKHMKTKEETTPAVCSVTRQVGDALLLERSQRSSRVVSIGIAPWGIVENNHELLGHNRDAPYHSISLPRSKLAVLNNRHAYFLLVDNGTSGRYGAEVILRRKLEKYISIQKLHPGTHCSTPVVCLVIEGGTNTIRAVLEYVTDTPPVPVVVCDGSGRAADLIAFTHKYASETGEQTVLESMKEYLVNTIQRTFEVNIEQADCLYQELLECTKRKNLITVFRISDQHNQELDQTILTALFKSQHLSPSEQLSLALTWNRVDIARSEIFVYGQEWPLGALDEAMMQALEHDRIDFVKLLLENGVSMKKFLTIPRLEELYNTKQGPTNTLGYILRDVRPHIPRGYMYTLQDIGLVINKLMGGAYRAQYTRRKFRMVYTKVMKRVTNNSFHRNSASFIRYYGTPSLTLSLLETLPTAKELPLFDYPFNELLIWAVLTKRQEMALLMWQHGEEALAKALIACKLYKAMAHEAAEDDLEAEIYEELRSYGKVFEDISLDLLDYCYREDDDQTQQLLTCGLENWSGQTCLSLAVAANHRALLSHPCSQIILADLWMGGLRTRKNTNIKIILGLFCPPYITKLEFKSKEELQLMPQTEEEHRYGGLDDENESIEEHSHDGQHRNTEADIEALISSHEPQLRDTIVTENGKVVTDDSVISSSSVTPTQFYQFPYEYNFADVKRHRPLRLKRKLYEFYTAPITKFWANSVAYVIFLLVFSYVVLVRLESTPSWQELYVISYICTLGCEKMREIISSEPVAVSHKFAVWALNMWNPCDAAAIIFFLIGLFLRLQPSSQSVGRVLYCVDIIYWYLRIFNILGVNKYLGPLVTMMGKMVKNMIYFVVLLLVVLMSFGICRQSILNPNEEPSWQLAKKVVFQPYFMLYGELGPDIAMPVTKMSLEKYARTTEVDVLIQRTDASSKENLNVFADSIYPDCNEDPDKCTADISGRWIPPLVMAVYLLVANILLINLLIAVFNNIFIEVNAISHQVWMFQRFTVVMEYEQKPTLPPPLIIFSHIFFALKYLKRKIQGEEETYDNGLKLFLEKEDLEQLYDFEEECVEGYFREKETKLLLSVDEKIKQTADRTENIQQKVEDINQKENNQNSSIQNVEFRVRKLEELAEQTLSTMTVIHRFMAVHSTIGQGGTDVPEMRLDTTATTFKRRRHASEHSEPYFEASEGFAGSRPASSLYHTVRRKGPVRSMTEVRPSVTSDTFLTMETIRALRDGREQRTLAGIEVVDNQQKSVVEERGDLCSDDRKTPERQKTSFSLNDEDVASTENVLSDSGLRLTSGSLGCLDMAEMESVGIGLRRPSQGFSDAHSSHGDAPSSRITVGERTVTWAEPSIKVIPPTTGRSALMAMHAEYTSITDELETMCGLLSPPRSPCLLSPPRCENKPTTHPTVPRQRTRHASEMSNSEMAAFLEKETLRDAEESDYLLMQDLIQHRIHRDGPMRLHRSSAIEMDAPSDTDETPMVSSENVEIVCERAASKGTFDTTSQPQEQSTSTSQEETRC